MTSPRHSRLRYITMMKKVLTCFIFIIFSVLAWHYLQKFFQPLYSVEVKSVERGPNPQDPPIKDASTIKAATNPVVAPLVIQNCTKEVLVVKMDNSDIDNIQLYRDVYTQEQWPEVEANQSDPGAIPSLVHYYWCESKLFHFVDYLGLLSAIRILKPQKIIFHHYHLPTIDEMWYQTWFQELKQAVPNLVLRKSPTDFKCGSKDILNYVLTKLSERGGVYIGERVVITHVPQLILSEDFFHSFSRINNSDDLTHGMILIKKNFPENSVDDKIKSISQSLRRCPSVGEFNAMTSSQTSDSVGPCLFLDIPVSPKDIWNYTTKFSELARWLYYGKRARIYPVQSDDELIPMVTHIVWITHQGNNGFEFLHYLSVLSALHVAGFKAVYVHGILEPTGPWWDKLKQENIKFIPIEGPETVFQQKVGNPPHQSDVLRLSILLRYGGAYQDRDIIWSSKIPDNIRKYPMVACPDWPYNGDWPESFNMGVMMAKRNSPWLREFLSTFRYYRDDKWAFNAVMMPYKAYEHQPDQLYIDRYLQAICFRGICHPAWHQDYKRDIADKRPVADYDWREARSFHFTVPKPPDSLRSADAIKNGQDMFAQIGRQVLEKSGRLDLLN